MDLLRFFRATDIVRVHSNPPVGQRWRGQRQQCLAQLGFHRIRQPPGRYERLNGHRGQDAITAENSQLRQQLRPVTFEPHPHANVNGRNICTATGDEFGRQLMTPLAQNIATSALAVRASGASNQATYRRKPLREHVRASPVFSEPNQADVVSGQRHGIVERDASSAQTVHVTEDRIFVNNQVRAVLGLAIKAWLLEHERVPVSGTRQAQRKAQRYRQRTSRTGLASSSKYFVPRT